MAWSTEPLAGSPLYFWNAITACWVVRPYDPSAPDNQNPRSSSRCWSCAVASPPPCPTATIGAAAGPMATLFDGSVMPVVVAVVDGSGLVVVVVARVVVGAAVVVVVDALVGVLGGRGRVGSPRHLGRRASGEHARGDDDRCATADANGTPRGHRSEVINTVVSPDGRVATALDGPSLAREAALDGCQGDRSAGRRTADVESENRPDELVGRDRLAAVGEAQRRRQGAAHERRRRPPGRPDRRA